MRDHAVGKARTAVAAGALLIPWIVVAAGLGLLVQHVMGASFLSPERVSAWAIPVGLLLAWASGTLGWVARQLPVAIDGGTASRASRAVLAGFLALALIQTARVSAFMVDPTLGRDAAVPSSGVPHMCLPAYLQAAELSRAGDPNVYDESHYEAFAAKDLLTLRPPSAYADGATDAMHSHEVHIESDHERGVFAKLRCTCGCPRDPANLLSTCACPFAEAARVKVRGQLAAGVPDEAILAAYVASNGPLSLATSTPTTTQVVGMQGYLSDPFEYPPPFLLVPRALLALSNDFVVLRAAWFVFQALALFGISFALAVWLGGREGLVAGLLLPALWGSLPFAKNVEIGQVHLLVVALAVVGVAAAVSGRELLGGALLGAAIAAKLAPALLLVYLVAQRRTRAVVWTFVWLAGYGLLALAVLGRAPFVAFVSYHLPRLASGDAFAFFLGRPSMLTGNFGAYALPLKLRAFGVPGMTLATAAFVRQAYLVLLVPIAFAAARRARSRLDTAERALALANLAALGSPLAPDFYVVSGVVWLVTLLGPRATSRLHVAALAALWVGLGLVCLPDPHPLRDGLVAQLGVAAFLVWAAVRRSEPAAATGADQSVMVTPLASEQVE